MGVWVLTGYFPSAGWHRIRSNQGAQDTRSERAVVLAAIRNQRPVLSGPMPYREPFIRADYPKESC
jgi:hypothetical protein